MCDIIAVSNRAMCGDFLSQVKKISDERIALILREKDLSEEEYERLAKEVMEICPDVILHTFTGAAHRLGVKRIHLPMQILRSADLTGFDRVGASVHSVNEAVEAQRLGVSYVTAGHIFATDCKKGVPPRGLDFLRDVCEAVGIPVYAIGGISEKNVKSAIEAGASGVCVMSGMMKCGNVSDFLRGIRI